MKVLRLFIIILIIVNSILVVGCENLTANVESTIDEDEIHARIDSLVAVLGMVTTRLDNLEETVSVMPNYTKYVYTGEGSPAEIVLPFDFESSDFKVMWWVFSNGFF